MNRIPENDPATGSAAAFAGAVLRFAPPGGGRHDVVIEQGHEMGRPSRIM